MTTENHDAQGGHFPLTPPPPADPSASAAFGPTPPPDKPGRSAGTTAIMVVTAVVGSIALLGAGGTAAAAAVGNIVSSSSPDTVQKVDVDGIEGIDLDADASTVRVEFGDVEEAELAITNGRGNAWKFERDGDELVVSSPRGVFGWWFGNWFGDGELAVLTLPESLRDSGLDGDLTLNAGMLQVDGEFGGLDIKVNAGELRLNGAAEEFDLRMSAGSATVELDSVSDAELGISAGDMNVRLTGTPPVRTTVDASAGSVDLVLPDVVYTITHDVSAGDLDAVVDQGAGARNAIDVSVSAGSVTIRPGS